MEFDGGRNLVSRLGAYPDPGWYLGYDVGLPTEHRSGHSLHIREF